MKFLSILLLAAAAAAQTAPAAAPPANAQLPIKKGEWKMIAMVHNQEGDSAKSFFNCNTETDLAHLVPQPAHLPAGLACQQDSSTVTADGVTVVISCRSASTTLKTTYDLVRKSDQLVTGTMTMQADVEGQHQQSTTNIAYQWQQEECVDHSVKAPAGK